MLQLPPVHVHNVQVKLSVRAVKAYGGSRGIAPLILNTGYTQKNDAVSKVNKKFISHLTRAQRTPSAAATVQVPHALITILQCVHPGSHDTHPHGNQIHPRLGVACPL
jgi:hypothetical protein